MNGAAMRPLDWPAEESSVSNSKTTGRLSGPGRWLQVLHDAAATSKRKTAVEQLSQCDWRTQPNVASAPIQAAKSDPAPVVRADCIHALAKMRVNTQEAVQTVEALKNDSDLRVRQEVLLALAVLTSGK